MPSAIGSIGIVQSSGTLIQSVEISVKTSEKLIVAADGSFGYAFGFDKVFSFSIRGKGATSVAVADSASGLTAVTGGVTIIKTVKRTTKSTDFPDFDIAGDNWPNATSS